MRLHSLDLHTGAMLFLLYDSCTLRVAPPSLGTPSVQDLTSLGRRRAGSILFTSLKSVVSFFCDFVRDLTTHVTS